MSPNDPRLVAALALLLLALPLTAAPAPKARPKEGGIAYLAFGRDGSELRTASPDGRGDRAAVKFARGDWPTSVRLDRDGSRAVVFVIVKARPPAGATGEVRVYDLTRPDRPPATLTAGLSAGTDGGGRWEETATPVWGADDHTVYVNRTTAPPEGKPARADRVWSVTRYDVRTRKGTPVALPQGYSVQDVSPDGQTLLVASATPRAEAGGGDHYGTHLADAATLKLTEMAKSFHPCRFSPDGKKVLGLKMAERPSNGSRLTVLDAKTRTETEVKMGGVVFSHFKALWSADGDRLLVSRELLATGEEEERQRAEGAFVPTVVESFTCAPDGSGRRPLPARIGGGKLGRWEDFDWR